MSQPSRPVTFKNAYLFRTDDNKEPLVSGVTFKGGTGWWVALVDGFPDRTDGPSRAVAVQRAIDIAR